MSGLFNKPVEWKGNIGRHMTISQDSLAAAIPPKINSNIVILEERSDEESNWNVARPPDSSLAFADLLACLR